MSRRRMRLLDRYIAIAVVIHFAFALGALLAVFSTINLMQELRDVGTGSYGATQALWFTLLTVPSEAFQLFPAAALVGGVSALGTLSGNNETVAMWAAGVSKRRMIRSVVQVAILLIIVAVGMGELLAAPLAQRATRERSVALSAGKAMSNAKGLWAREGSRFINIRHPTEHGIVYDVYVYEFGDDETLQSFSHARDAVYENDRWEAGQITVNRITEAGVVSQRHQSALWSLPLTPKQIALVSLPPEYLSLRDLARSSRELMARRENPHRYQTAFWNRAAIPFLILIMLALAVPLVLTTMRGARLGQRIVVGALLGVGFQMFTETFATFGLAYGIPPFLNALIPVSLATMVAVVAIRRMAD